MKNKNKVAILMLVSSIFLAGCSNSDAAIGSSQQNDDATMTNKQQESYAAVSSSNNNDNNPASQSAEFNNEDLSWLDAVTVPDGWRLLEEDSLHAEWMNNDEDGNITTGGGTPRCLVRLYPDQCIKCLEKNFSSDNPMQAFADRMLLQVDDWKISQTNETDAVRYWATNGKIKINKQNEGTVELPGQESSRWIAFWQANSEELSDDQIAWVLNEWSNAAEHTVPLKN